MLKRRSAGFTLIELMVVIVILGGLIALVGPNVWNALFTSNQKTALIQMHNFGAAIDNYRMVHKKLPDSLDTLTQSSDSNPEPYLRDVPNDPWDNPYDYRVEGSKKYRIHSRGEDGQPDTPDDIVWPETKE